MHQKNQQLGFQILIQNRRNQEYLDYLQPHFTDLPTALLDFSEFSHLGRGINFGSSTCITYSEHFSFKLCLYSICFHEYFFFWFNLIFR